MGKDASRAATVRAMHRGNGFMWKRHPWIGGLNRGIIPGGNGSQKDPGNDGRCQIKMAGDASQVIRKSDSAKSHRNVDDRSACACGFLCVSQGSVGRAEVYGVGG